VGLVRRLSAATAAVKLARLRIFHFP
jgi:hypothetical protein